MILLYHSLVTMNLKRSSYYLLLNVITFLALSIVAPLKSSAIAWTDWSDKTPGGNEISDNWGSMSIVVGDSLVLKGLVKWYFYQNHIVGINTNNEGDTSYFIFNEGNDRLVLFNNSQSWKKTVLNNSLKPRILTRWFSHSWERFTFPELLFTFILGLVIILSWRYYFSKKTFLKLGGKWFFFLTMLIYFFVLFFIKQHPFSL